MPHPIRIPFPKKGLNRNVERSDQNGIDQGADGYLPESVWNAVNVMPYDRYDRLRGGQRPGTARLFAAISNVAIAAMGNTSVALDPSTAPASNVVIDEKFTEYANGSTLNATGIWSTTGTVDYTINNAGAGTAFLDHVQADTTTPPVWYSGTPINLGETYQLDATYTWAGTDATQLHYFIYARTNGSIPSGGNGIAISIDTSNTASVTSSTNVRIGDIGGGTDYATAALSTFNPAQGTTFVMTLLVQQNAFTLKINGTTVLGPATVTALTGNAGFAFGITGITGPATPTLPHARVNELKISTATAAAFRKTYLVAVSGGTIYGGDITALAATSGGTNALPPGAIPSLSFGQGNAYVAGGTNPFLVTLSTNATTTLTATAGSVPQNCTITTVWRDRLVFAAPPSAPANFFFSRVGTYTDYDYSQTDPAAAFAGNASTAGHIGDPITALMPFNDDVLLIGGDHHLWRVSGDPADGGSIDLVSDAIGVLSNTAWTKDPSGNIYFMGPGGLYKIAAGGSPELMTGTTLNQYFSQINRATSFVNLEWDRDRQGMFIFVTPALSSIQPIHVWYDARNNGIWLIEYPNTHGPICTTLYDDSSPGNRVILLGGIIGLIQKITPAALNDDGATIISSITLGPFQPSTPAGDAVVTMLDVTLGEIAVGDASTVFNCNVVIAGGKTAYEVTEGTPRMIAGTTFTAPGYQLTRQQRVRGGWFTITVSNTVANKYWSLEHVVMHVEGQGKQR